jgi:hypothetical protein
LSLIAFSIIAILKPVFVPLNPSLKSPFKCLTLFVPQIPPSQKKHFRLPF